MAVSEEIFFQKTQIDREEKTSWRKRMTRRLLLPAR